MTARGWKTEGGARNPAERLEAMVGRTPLIEIRLRLDGRSTRVFAKYESENPTGSIKDRMAFHILHRAYDSGRLRPGDRIVEASSGNTAISFAALGRALGHPVTIFMPDWMSAERVSILKAFGAELMPVSRAEGGFVESIRRARAFAGEHAGTFEPRQFESEWNVEAHELGTGAELLAQLATLGLAPDAFVAGVGTGGTVMGVGRALRRASEGTRVHPVEPAESPVLTAGRNAGSHRIQGISDEFVPDVVRLDEIDAPIAVSDGDSIIVAQRLARELGLGVGISSGANLIAALRVIEELGVDAVVATVFADSHKKYLSTDLFHEEPVRSGYVAPRLALESFAAIRTPPNVDP